MGEEREIDISQKFINRLSQFYPQEGELQRAIDQNLEEATDKAHLYRLLTENKGSGKSHASGKPEGEKKGT